MAGDIQIRWDDFKGGDWGNRDPSRADRDMWTGQNMVIYRSGMLGPRAGVVQRTYATVPDLVSFDAPKGFTAYGQKLLAVMDDTIYALRDDLDSVSTPFAVYPSAPTTRVTFVEGNNTLYSLTGGVLYKHVAGGATTTVTTPAAFQEIVRWGLWMVATTSTFSSPSARIYFNQVDAAGPDYDSWPTNNFYDVGNTDGITALESIFNTLYVGKASGWWAVTGVLGDLASIREVANGNGPIESRLAVTQADNRIAYWSGRGLASDLAGPTFFNGASSPAVDESWLAQRSTRSGYGNRVAAMPNGRRTLFIDANASTTRVLMLSNGAWTQHVFPMSIDGFAPAELRQPGGALSGSAGGIYPGVVMMAPENFSFDAVPFFLGCWHTELDRPGRADGVLYSPYESADDLGSGSLVSGEVSLRPHWEPNGRQMIAKRVIVQGRKWNSQLDGTTNRLKVRVDALGKWGGGTQAAAVQEWTELSAASDDDGTDFSWRFDFGDQGAGNGVQVVFEAVEGVAIREVVVEAEVQRDR